MKLVLKLFLSLFIIYLVGCKNDYIIEDNQLPKITQYTLNQLDTLRLNNLNQEKIIYLLGQTSVLEDDSINESKSLIIYNIIANYTVHKIQIRDFDLNTPNTRFIISFLRIKGFYLNLDSPSDWHKLHHYLNEGKFKHIWNRFIGRNYHIYSIVLFVFLFILFIHFKFKKKNHEKN